MICNNCGASFDDNMMNCPCCGAPVNRYNENPIYTAPNYSQPYNYTAPEKSPSLGQYIGWTLLAHIFGPVSLIITIVMACMGENKSRANFFRAQLVIWGINIVVAIVLVAILSVVGLSLFSVLEDYSYDYGLYDSFMSLIMSKII